MKKIFAITALILVCAGIAYTTSTNPRTNRVTTVVRTADVALNDTIRFTPQEYETIVLPATAIVDTVTYIPRTTFAKLGDEVTFLLTNSSGSNHKVYLPAAYWVSAGADSIVSLTSAKKAALRYKYDGTKYIQTTKMIQ